MKHYEKQAWMEYVEERVVPDEMSKMELHLYQCDLCLSHYVTCMEQSASMLPLMETDTQVYVDSILNRTIGTKRAWFRSTMFHYGIAAAATLFLVVSGFFHSLSQEMGAIGASRGMNSTDITIAPTSLQEPPPLSDQLLNKTLTWLDTFQNGHDKGGSRP
ncbi:hypothetical protein GK047_23290 [Paenibacillus sp. SYP-B3998]|uniref:Zf-HC2 domain-containing protein n=1 Tax=Paenibacillus sp. SYP-B3998 TaxID=2678564 RepID=A0A6G4A356_9BACL|nr:hypothetical protein [Paenibacillus sp. SYP-B3998]NEW08926.1 hypothetical protein [Paenibacillus sp. SYP-B3998]